MLKREGDGVSPLQRLAFSHFQAARDDWDGNSRYRVTKILLIGSELGWYRERLAPKVGERFIFLKILRR